MTASNKSTEPKNPEPIQDKGLVLIVDDQSRNLQLAASVLRPYYRLLLADSGQKAMLMAAEKQPDLILLDVMMPGLSGYDTCRELKAHAATCHIPVIFLTARTAEEDLIEAFEVGGVDFITKPFKAREVLARIKTQVSLRQSQKQLQRHNDFKDKLLSVIGHDLREPLKNIVGIMEMIEENQQILKKEDVISYCSLLKQRALQTTDLLGNLVEWSKSQMRVGEIARQPVSLVAELTQVLSQLDHMAENKQIKIEQQVPEGLVALSNAHMLQAVLRNLLANSIKFTRSGKRITVSASQQDHTITIAVTDEGIGIKPEIIEKLLTKTNTYWSYGTNREKGSGLGLKLCLDFIEQLGGMLHIESEPGKGSTFHFTLPAAV